MNLTRQKKLAREIRLISSPIRVAMLNAMGEDERSPTNLSGELKDYDYSVQRLSYHMKCLADEGLVTLTRTRPRRGAIEHFYKADPHAVALAKSIKRLFQRYESRVA